jgi:hypothetical protein
MAMASTAVVNVGARTYRYRWYSVQLVWTTNRGSRYGKIKRLKLGIFTGTINRDFLYARAKRLKLEAFTQTIYCLLWMKRLKLKTLTPSMSPPPIGEKWGERVVEQFRRRANISDPYISDPYCSIS